MKPLVPSFFIASIALGVAAAQGETIAVLELRSRVHPVVAAELSDRVLEDRAPRGARGPRRRPGFRMRTSWSPERSRAEALAIAHC